MDLTPDSSDINIPQERDQSQAITKYNLSLIQETMKKIERTLLKKWSGLKVPRGYRLAELPMYPNDVGGFGVDIPMVDGEYVADARRVSAIIRKALDNLGVEYIREQCYLHWVEYTVYGHMKNPYQQ